MCDRATLLEAALDYCFEGIALLDANGQLVLWNDAAEATTGYSKTEILARPIPCSLEALLLDPARENQSPPDASHPLASGTLVKASHKLGPELQVFARRSSLHDAAGERIGTAILFHPAHGRDALPHGETRQDEAEEMEASQAELEERLRLEFDDLARGGPPFGILWIGVDQAQELRKTHGAAPCRAMREKVRHALALGLKPSDQMGRWGGDEYLIVAHDSSAEILSAHAQTLVGWARTADFRWWGDRLSVTVSIGAAQAESADEETLAQLLERARQAMEASHDAGGNRVTLAARRSECSPS